MATRTRNVIRRRAAWSTDLSEQETENQSRLPFLITARDPGLATRLAFKVFWDYRPCSIRLRAFYKTNFCFQKQKTTLRYPRDC